MADKIISASLKVNTGTSVQDINAVNKSLDQTSNELKDTDKDAKASTSSFTNLKGALEKVPGPLGAVNQGVNTVSTSLKALAANPIVLVITLLVAALVALYKAFASTESGAEKIEQIFSGLGAIVTVIRDRILALAGAVISFFKGDFKEAIEQTKAAVTGVGAAITKAYSEAADATRELQEAQDELNRGLLVSRAKLNRDLAETKELISDETASYKDRKNAIEEVRKAEETQTEAELANAEKTLKALERKMALDKEDSELNDEYAKQQARVFEIQEEQAQNQRSLNKQAHQIDQQQRAEADAANKARHDAEMKRLADEKKAWEDSFNSRLNAQKMDQQFIDDGIAQRQKAKEDQQKQDEQDQKDRDAYQAGVDAKEISNYQKLIDKKLKADKAADDADKKLKDLKVKREQGVLETTSSLFAAAANLAGKQSAVGKALAIAGATIDTFRGAQAAFTGMVSSIPGPVGFALGIAAAAAAVATGIANVKNILAVKVPGGADASGTIPSASAPSAPAAPVAPTQQGTSIDQSSIKGIGDATSGRAYVVEADITHDQDRNERLNRAARLGN